MWRGHHFLQTVIIRSLFKRSGKKRAADLNRLAASIVEDATSEADEKEGQPENEKDPAAIALGRKGGVKGGKAPAEKLSAKRRKEIARKAAEARWSSKGGTDA